MKWFYKLKSVYRILITIASWVPLVVMAGILGSSEKLSTPLTILALVFLALGIFFTVFAVKARNAEKPPKQTAVNEPKTYRASVILKNSDGSVDVTNSGNTCHYTPNEAKDLEIESTNASYDFPIHTKVVGVTFDNRQDYLSESEDDDPIIIKHTPSEKYPESLSIYNQRIKKMLGHINAELASDLVDEYGDGCKFSGSISEITGGENDLSYGCNIVIENEIEND